MIRWWSRLFVSGRFYCVHSNETAFVSVSANEWSVKKRNKMLVIHSVQSIVRWYITVDRKWTLCWNRTECKAKNKRNHSFGLFPSKHFQQFTRIVDTAEYNTENRPRRKKNGNRKQKHKDRIKRLWMPQVCQNRAPISRWMVANVLSIESFFSPLNQREQRFHSKREREIDKTRRRYWWWWCW